VNKGETGVHQEVHLQLPEEVEAGGKKEVVEDLGRKTGGVQTEVTHGEALKMEENPEERGKTEAKNMIIEMIEVIEETKVIPEKEVLGDIKTFCAK